MNHTLDIEKVEVRARKLARRTRNNIPSGWWRTMFRSYELRALLETSRWKLERVEGTMKLPGVKPARVVQTFLREVR
jgi:hypothetical protein